MKKKKRKKSTKKTPQPRRGGEEKRVRHKVEEALLADRLSLDHDWIDRWEEDGQYKEESFAPEQVPTFIKGDVDAVNAAVDQLVAAGCRKQVVYFCLNELSPEAEKSRFERKSNDASKDSKHGRNSPIGRPEDELDTSVAPPPKLAQRQQFKELPTLARRVRRLIHRYRNELWLVAHAIERRNNWQRVRRLAHAAQQDQNPPATEPDFGADIDLPSSTLTKLSLPEDALSLVESSLLWVARLAKGYAAPFEERVLRSKAYVFLTGYVNKYADLSKFRRKAWGGRDNPLSALTSLVGGKGWSPSYLNGKLQKFKQDHPDLYDLLMDKLDELHKFHSPMRVLFLSSGNSARSQMAEGLLRHMAGEHYEVFSAGTRPVGLNPNTVQVMVEVGVDISPYRSKSVDEYAGQAFNYVITLCDNAKESCPVFPDTGPPLHHSFQDPAALPADRQLESFRKVRDEITSWLVRVCPRLHKSLMTKFPKLHISPASH